MNKKIRARAIIICDKKIVSMYREREGRSFYTFPGGGMEGNETEEECLKREIFEELGIIAEPIKKVYIYENENNIEHFYLCKHISGQFGTGQGEEYQENQTNGLYVPTFVEICEIPNIALMPPEVASAFYEDYMKNGNTLRDDVKFVYGKIK